MMLGLVFLVPPPGLRASISLNGNAMHGPRQSRTSRKSPANLRRSSARIAAWISTKVFSTTCASASQVEDVCGSKSASEVHSLGYEAGDEDGLSDDRDSIADLLNFWVEAVTDLPGDYGRYTHSFLHAEPTKSKGRHRDIFPMCRITNDLGFDWPQHWCEKRCSAVSQCVNARIWL
jgi:hypothetical protein